MIRYDVLVSKRASANLRKILSYIAKESSLRIATAFVRDIRLECEALASFPQRGIDLEALSPGLRSVGFRKVVLIVFRIRKNTVTIIAVFYGGRNVEARIKFGDKG